MAANVNNVQIVVEHLTKGLDRIQASIDEQRKLGVETDALQKEYDELNAALQRIDLAGDLIPQFQATTSALEAAQQKVADYTGAQPALSSAVTATAAKQAEATKAFEAARSAVNGLDVRMREHQSTVARLRSEQEGNKTAIAAATAQYGAASPQVKALADRDRELAEAIKAEQAAQAASNLERTAAKQSLDATRGALSDQARELAAAEKALQANVRAGNAAANQAASLTANLGTLGTQLDRAGVDTKDLEGEQRRLAAELANTEAKASTFGATVDRGLREAQKSSGLLAAGFATLSTAAGSLLASGITKLKDGVASFITGLKQAFLDNETFERSMRLAGGSADEYAGNLKAVQEVSEELAFTDDALAKEFLKLKNAGLDPAGGALRDVATIAKALGGEEEKLASVTDLLSEAYSKGEVNAELLNKANKQQIPLLDALATVLGKTKDQTLALVQEGKVGSVELEAAFASLGTTLQGAAAAVDQSFGGALQRFGVPFDGFVDKLTSSGLQRQVIEIFSGVNASANESADQVSEAAVRIGGVFRVVVGVIDAAVGTIRLAFNGVTVAVNGVVLGLSESLGALFTTLGKVPGAVGEPFREAALFLESVSKTAQENIAQDGRDIEASLIQTGRGFVNAGQGAKDALVPAEEAAADTAAAVERLPTETEKASAAIKDLGLTGGEAGEGLAKLVPQQLDTRLADLTQRSVDLRAQLQGLDAQLVAAGGAGTQAGRAILQSGEDIKAALGLVDGAVGSLREEQFKRLGVDASAALTGIDSKARDLLTTFDSVATDSAVDFKIIQAAAKNALKELDTPQEIEAFILSLERASAAGRDVSVPLEEAKKRLGEMQQAADPAAKALEDAFRQLGVVSSKAVGDAASAASTAFQLIRRQTGDFSSESGQAFAAYAEAALKAAASQGEIALQGEIANLRITAAGFDQVKQLDLLAAKYGEKGAAAEQSSTRAVRAAGAELQATEAVTAALDARTQALQDYSAAEERRRAASPDLVAGGNLVDGRPGFDFLSAQDQQLVLEQARLRFNAQNASQRRRTQGISTTGNALLEQFAAEDRQQNDEINRLISALNSGGTAAEAARNSLRTNLGLGPNAPDRGTAENNQEGRQVRTVRIELPAVNGFPGGVVTALDNGGDDVLAQFLRALADAQRGST